MSGVESDGETPSRLIGKQILDIVDIGDRSKFAAHLRDASCPPAPPAISDPIRLRVAPDRPTIRVRAQSRLFRANPTSGEVDFIMSTHTIVDDDDADATESTETGATTSIANGESSTSDGRFRSTSPSDATFPIGDFAMIGDLDPWGSTFPFGEIADEPKERRDRSSEGPLAPRTPSTPGDAALAPPPPPPEEPNRLRTLLSKRPGVVGDAPAPTAPVAAADNRILKDLLKQEDEDATGSESSAPHTPLTPHAPHTPHTPHTPAALSPLHSAHPLSHPHAHHPHGPHASHPQHQRAPPSHQQHPHALHNKSDMLLRVIMTRH